jgi:hypothetical protein
MTNKHRNNSNFKMPWEKQNKNTTQYVMDTTIRKHTQITHIRHEASYQQLEVKMNRTSVLCGNRKCVLFRHTSSVYYQLFSSTSTLYIKWIKLYIFEMKFLQNYELYIIKLSVKTAKKKTTKNKKQHVQYNI